MSYQTCETCGSPLDVEYGCVCSPVIVNEDNGSDDMTRLEACVVFGLGGLLIGIIVTFAILH